MAWFEWLRRHAISPKPGCPTCVFRDGHLCRNRSLEELVARHPLEHYHGMSCRHAWTGCGGEFYRGRSP